MDDKSWNQLAAIVKLVEKARDLQIGRTAVMKFLYLMKEIKSVPLDYRFTLYTYGPFDSDVLDDLAYAESLKAVESDLVAYPGGSGYVFRPGPKVEHISSRATKFLSRYGKEIEWVIGEFGGRSAGELEMISTIIYVDRQATRRGKPLSLNDLAAKVVEIKPHLDIPTVRREVERLRERGYLSAAG